MSRPDSPNEYPKHLFRHPGPYGNGKRSYEVAGADNEAREALLVSLGWYLTKDEAYGVAAQVDADAVTAMDVPSLRLEYQRVVKKKPFMGWDEATLREKLKEAK